MNSATKAATRIGNFRTFAISRELNPQTTSTDANILRLVGSNRRVLELGCGSGHMSLALRDQGCSVVGIEIHPEAAQHAAAICERVIVGDLDYVHFERELGADRFDVILAADVLEHLKDPLSILQAVKRFLLPHGHFVISVPNVAHISVRLALLAGKFSYSETGLLDQTHLRFLTRESLEKLMADANLAIGHFERITNLPGDPSQFEVPYDPEILPTSVIEKISQDPEAWTYQFVLSGYPLPESGLVFIQDRIERLAYEADAARHEIKRLEAALSAAQEQTQSITAVERRVADLLRDNERLQTEITHLQETCDESERVIGLMQEEAQAQSNLLDVFQSENADGELRVAALVEERESLVVEVARLQDISEQSGRALESLREEKCERNLQIDEQNRRIRGLNAQVETLLTREKDLRDMLLEAHDQLLKRDEEIALTLASTLPQAPPPSIAPAVPSGSATGGKYLHYQQLIHKIRELVRSRIPDGGSVLVVSKGDDDLIRIDPCRGAHFPQREDGRYAGYYPTDGDAAVEHLKQLQKRGSQFFLIPQTALWWLNHYRELADYLDKHCTRIIDQPDICLMFDIANAQRKPAVAEARVEIVNTSRIRPFGVNISGNLTSEKGVGEAVRSQTRSFLAAGVPVALNNILEDTAVNLVNEFTDFSDENPYSVNLIHLNADALSDFIESHEKEYFQDRYNIGFWAWETSTFPTHWWDRFQYLDEIWVGSDFVLDAISRVSPIPVIKTPLAVPNRLSFSSYSRSHFGLHAKTFVFLFAFDYMSIAQRKNPQGLVQSFRKAFSSREDVTLVLKCAHSEAHPFEARMVKEACQGTNIKIIDGVLSREEVNALMSAADCYVSLHRSEGFGLTMAEAMSFGKPVIATGYSGNMAFMTTTNSYLVKHKLVEIDRPHGPYREGEWADPDLDHAAELMRFVFKNRTESKETGRRAQVDILRNLCPAATGAHMRNRLLRIAQLGRIQAPDINEDDAPKAKNNGGYQHVVERIHKIVQANVPNDACVVVVSRGDDNLLTFTGRAGWHFPQDSEGKYAGYHPANDAEAIGHLETLRDKGGSYLLLPQTAFWWLDHYSELRSHLDSRYHRVWSDPDCIIYGLAEKSNGVVARLRQRIAKRAQGVS